MLIKTVTELRGVRSRFLSVLSSLPLDQQVLESWGGRCWGGGLAPGSATGMGRDRLWLQCHVIDEFTRPKLCW
jgi:hypothetical protein